MAVFACNRKFRKKSNSGLASTISGCYNLLRNKIQTNCFQLHRPVPQAGDGKRIHDSRRVSYEAILIEFVTEDNFRLKNFERITLVCDNHLHPQGREFIEESTINYLSQVIHWTVKILSRSFIFVCRLHRLLMRSSTNANG